MHLSTISLGADNSFNVGGQRFRVALADASTARTTSDEVVLLKKPEHFGVYEQVARRRPIRNIVEVGIFEGGSAILLANLFPEARIVGIDLRKPSATVNAAVEKNCLSDRIKFYYETSQDDAAKLNEIMDREFGDEEVDLIIDDASHQYWPSRATFEVLFPKLAVGGAFVIEDWAWAHWAGFQTTWPDAPALTNLIFEITMLAGASSGIVREMHTNNFASVITKGRDIGRGRFSLDNSILNRGRRIALL